MGAKEPCIQVRSTFVLLSQSVLSAARLVGVAVVSWVSKSGLVALRIFV